MTDSQLEAIRVRRTQASAADVDDLLAYVDFLRGLVSDLREDSSAGAAYERGQRDERANGVWVLKLSEHMSDPEPDGLEWLRQQVADALIQARQTDRPIILPPGVSLERLQGSTGPVFVEHVSVHVGSFRAECNAVGQGTVELGGQRLGHLCQAWELSCRVGEVPRLRLEMLTPSGPLETVTTSHPSTPV